MSDERDPNDPLADEPSAPNVFDPAFLRLLREREEPATANEATFGDNWKVVSAGAERWAVLRDWESLESRDQPVLVARRRELALLACAVLPGVGREPLFHLGGKAGSEGFPLLSILAEGGLQSVATMSHFNTALAAALHNSETAIRSPYRFTCMLEAAGPTTLELSGRLLYRRLVG
jgi:hypothetical protein